MTQKIKSPVLVLILSLVTCGIYPMIYVYTTTEDIKNFTNDQNLNPVLDLILSLVTCGIYYIYWLYRTSKQVLDMQNRTGVNMPNDVSVVALILSVFGLSSVSLMLIQTELNRVWERVG